MTMNKSKHTPGPWAILVPAMISGDSRWVVDSEQVLVASVSWDREQAERHANAALIAEAPAMMALLEEACTVHNRAEWLQRAADALAKARGDA